MRGEELRLDDSRVDTRSTQKVLLEAYELADWAPATYDPQIWRENRTISCSRIAIAVAIATATATTATATANSPISATTLEMYDLLNGPCLLYRAYSSDVA